MNELKNTRILGAVGIVSLLLGIILPYFTVSFLGYSDSISLIECWEGKVMLVLILVNVLFIFKDYLEKYIPQIFSSDIGKKVKNMDHKFEVIPTVLVALLAITVYVRTDVDVNYIKHGLGFWTLWLGVICLVAHAFLYKKSANVNMQPMQPQYQQPVQPTQQQYQQPVQPMQPQYQQPVQPTQQVNNSIDQNVKYCPSCGTKSDINSKFCPSCGRAF